MCGIAGVVDRTGHSVSARVLTAMSSVLAHRGPDGDGAVVDGCVGLVHRRLAIIDLTDAARQPMTSPSGDLTITYNGEVFNFREIRAELQRLGHAFTSQSDTEVILHAYDEWGLECVNRFNGMFAFGLWDRTRQQLILARDRFGIKPLYYYHADGVFVFASEIKAILRHPAVARRPCYPALAEYFTFQNVLTDRTLFDGIRTLAAGCWMVLDLRAGTLQPHRYWDVSFAVDPVEATLDEAADEVYRLFRESVTRQLVSDVPIGSYLSGGMDSGSVTAVARQQLGRLLTFTAGFDLSSASGLEIGFDERANAEVVSNLLKTEHYEVVLHAGDMEHVMPDLIWHLEDLRVGQCYPNYYVARLASRFVKVVLSGGGGDELFGGYPWRYYQALSCRTRAEFADRYYGFWQRLVPDAYHARFFRQDVLAHVSGSPAREAFDATIRNSGVLASESVTDEECVNAALYFEAKTFLHGLLVVEDKVSMAHGLETRVPFLDNALVDFALRLPIRHKLRRFEMGQAVREDDVDKSRRQELRSADGKVVLRTAMSRIIPPDVTERPKQGFSAPDASWFKGESIDYLNDLLRSPRARLYEFIQPGFVEGILDEHCSGRTNRRLLIWSLLSFEWWLQRFF